MRFSKSVLVCRNINRKGDFIMTYKILEKVAETEILGRKITMYGSIENPLFLARDVADWIDYSKTAKGSRQVAQMLKQVDDDEKLILRMLIPGDKQKRDHSFLTEDGLYECCMKSRKPIAKQMRKEIKRYLKSIRMTGAAIPEGNEEKMVSYYFSALSSELQGTIVNELMQKNKELNEFYDQLMNTEGLMPINTVAKELEIGEYKLFNFLRDKKIFFYDKDKVNVPYERFRKEGKFAVKETPCHDGRIRSVTYATKKGLDYIRKLLIKEGYYKTETVSMERKKVVKWNQIEKII